MMEKLRLVSESLDDLLKPKDDNDVIKEIFIGTKLENEDPNKIFYFETRTLLGSLGELLMEENDIFYKKVNNQYYIIWGALIDLVKYYNAIQWGQKSYVMHILASGVAEDELSSQIKSELIKESTGNILTPKPSEEVMDVLSLDDAVKQLLVLNNFKFTHKLNYSTDTEYYFDNNIVEIVIKNTDSLEFVKKAFKYFNYET